MTYDKAYARDVLGADCSHCPLATAGQFVPSAGPSSADVAFIGETPSVADTREGVPFLGPAGRLLQTVNTQYGLKKEEVFLTNAILCRPPSGGSAPKLAISSCRPRLHKELSERGANTAVALGNGAALSVLGVEGVTKLRMGPGRVSPYETLEGLRIIPTVNPAACLRQSDMFPSLVADVGKVVATREPWTEPEFVVLDDPVDAIKHLQYLQARASDLIVDIEVDIDKDSSFDHPDRYDLLCVGLCHEPGKAVVIGERACADDRVRDAMADAFRASRLSNQNGKFDLAGLYPVLGPLELHFDTMLASYCLDERPGVHGLKSQAVEYLGAPQYDEDIKKYVKGVTIPELEHFKGYGRIPRDILYKYNAYDVVCTWDLKELQEKKLAASSTAPSWWEGRYPFKGLRELHDFLVMVGNELMYLELNGMPYDRTYGNELQANYLESLEGIENDLNSILIEAGYQKINPRSPKQVQGVFAFYRVRATSTDKDTLTLILEQMFAKYGEKAFDMSLYQFCETLLKYRDEHKMYSTYVKGLMTRLYRGRLYPTFMIHGTVTGRLSSRNPNAQNIPRRKAIKRQIIPGKPDNVFVQADYKQAELRILSWLAKDTYFRDILNDDSRDLFDELTPRLFIGKSKDMVGTEIDAETWKDIRVRVKAFVYGLGYGRTEFSIAHELRMAEKEAREIKDRFFATIPDIVKWQEWVKREVKIGHDLINPFGRHRRFHLITQENWKSVQNEALAFLPQSTSSDVCLRAMVRVRRDLRGSGAFIRNIVHDSILVDCPSDMADDVAKLLDRRMVESGQELVGDYIKFETDIAIGKHWGEV